MGSIIMSARTVGIEAHAVSIEVSISEEHRGPMSVSINAPEHVTTELRVKVKSAIQNSGYPYPEKRVYVKINGDVGRDTRAFDLPIALAVLAAQGTIPAGALDGVVAVGELALDGRVRGVRGVLPMVAGLDDHTLTFLVPRENYAEAREMEGSVEMMPVHTLADAVVFLLADTKTQAQILWDHASRTQFEDERPDVDFSDVRWQKHAVRAAEIAVAGGHSLLFEGPPGSGKTMIARRMATIMPRATFAEKIEAMSIASVAGVLNVEGWRRPFRAPHHSVSEVAILGGGPHGRPGEVSLAHNGVLFLDEAPEFKGAAVDAVATATRNGEVRLRDGAFPAAPLMVGASNPCPCGYRGHPRVDSCKCAPVAIEQYRKRAHRFPWQMVAQMPAVMVSELKNGEKNESSELIRARVEKARERQKARGVLNARLDPLEIAQTVSTKGNEYMAKSTNEPRLGWGSTLRIARTIADLAGSGLVCAAHLEEAATYLPKKES